ncbi:hypothetical protein ACFC4L_10820, partial [Streptomyces sp. NPDC055929]
HDVLAVVEIASPSTRVTDRKLKPALYAAAFRTRAAAGHRARRADPKTRSLPARREATKFLAPGPPGMP